MPTTDLVLKNATVYDFKKADIKVGEKFKVVLNQYPTEDSSWFTNNDSVLSIQATDGVAECEALEVGTVKIKIFDPTGSSVV